MFIEHRLNSWIEATGSRANIPLRLILWNGSQIDLSPEVPQVTIRLPHISAARFLLRPSLASLGAAYVEGAIEVAGTARDIIAVVNALARNSLRPVGKFGRLVRSGRHARHLDAKAIRYHYDVSDEFYAQFLDRDMVYSCAYFENGDEDLHTAQMKKIDHILRKLRLRQGQRLLDIGCGWGALVIRAAQHYDAHCLGITLSENQFRHARERIRQLGLEELVEIRMQDYRDVRGQFDRISSVGMFEHVGVQNLPEYFGAMNRLLSPGGLAVNHGITSTDPDSGETPFGGGEFIEKYVFPNGELAHVGEVIKAMQRGGLEVIDVENLRRHYARTCAMWSDNFEMHAGALRDIGGERRYRIWRVYLAGCSYAFEQDLIGLYQIVCGHAGGTPSALPWTRHHMYT